jgi:hypothetical protein
VDSAEVAQRGPEAVLLGSDILKFAGCVHIEVLYISRHLLSSLYLRVNSAEVAQGGPEAVLLGSDEAPLVNDVAAYHGRGGGHRGLRLRQQRLHQLWPLTRQVCRLLSNLRKVHENLSA